MEPHEIFQHWFILHKTVDFLKEDMERSKDAPLRLPYALTESIRLIGRRAHALERKAASEMKGAGIRLVNEFYDQREYFAVWSYRGATQMLRLHENVVRIQAQKKVEKITKGIFEQREARLKHRRRVITFSISLKCTEFEKPGMVIRQ